MSPLQKEREHMLVTNQGHGWAAWRQRGGPWWKTLAAPAPALPPHLLDCINRAPPWSASAQTWPSPSPFFFSPCTPTAILSYLNLHGSTNPLLIPTQMTDASSFDDIFLGQMMGSTSSFCPFLEKKNSGALVLFVASLYVKSEQRMVESKKMGGGSCPYSAWRWI